MTQRPRGRGAFHQIGLPGRLAMGIFAIHTVLLFFPPIPPDVKGSLWSYILAGLAVVLGVVEIRSHATALTRRWAGLRPAQRVLMGAGAALGTLAFGLGVRALSPELFDRWTQPEGVWEPLTMLAYLAAALLLLAAARGQAVRDRRHLHLFVAGYILLTLEELDYFGVFGGIIGRVNGVYVGAPHDLLELALEGLLPSWVVVVGAAVVLVAIGLALRSGHLQPARLARTLFAWRGLWIVAFVVFIGLAQIEDVGWVYLLGEPRIEELLELVASIFLLAFAAELAADAIRWRDPAERPAPPYRTANTSTMGGVSR